MVFSVTDIRVTHSFDSETVVEPNPSPERGRVMVTARCQCGETRDGFGVLTLTAWNRAITELSEHIISPAESPR